MLQAQWFLLQWKKKCVCLCGKRRVGGDDGNSDLHSAEWMIWLLCQVTGSVCTIAAWFMISFLIYCYCDCILKSAQSIVKPISICPAQCHTKPQNYLRNHASFLSESLILQHCLGFNLLSVLFTFLLHHSSFSAPCVTGLRHLHICYSCNSMTRSVEESCLLLASALPTQSLHIKASGGCQAATTVVPTLSQPREAPVVWRWYFPRMSRKIIYILAKTCVRVRHEQEGEVPLAYSVCFFLLVSMVSQQLSGAVSFCVCLIQQAKDL